MNHDNQSNGTVDAWWNLATGETTCNPEEAASWDRAGDGVEGLVRLRSNEQRESMARLGSQASSLKSAIEQAALHGLVVAFNRGGVRTESWAIAADRFAGDAFGAMCAAFVRAVELSTPSVDDPSERDEFLSQQETADLHSCCEEVSAGREAELERVAIRRLALADEQAAQAADLTIAVTSARAESGAIRLMLPNAIAHEDIIPFGNASGREYALDAENARLLYEQLAAALSEE